MICLDLRKRWMFAVLARGELMITGVWLDGPGAGSKFFLDSEVMKANSVEVSPTTYDGWKNLGLKYQVSTPKKRPAKPKKVQTVQVSNLSLRGQVMRRDEYRCGYCGGKADSIDHIIPKSKGGPNELWNLLACCKRCNAAKGNGTIEDFADWVLNVALSLIETDGKFRLPESFLPPSPVADLQLVDNSALAPAEHPDYPGIEIRQEASA